MTHRNVATPLFAALLALSMVVSLAGVPAAHALQTVSQPFAMPVRLDATVSEFNCQNATGPQITFEGAVVLSGLDIELIFRNNINKDVHTLAQDVDIVAEVRPGAQIVIPKQPVLGGVGGNPFIWLQLIESNGAALTGEIFLGRCVQGPVTASFYAQATAAAILGVLDCANNPGPLISVEGSLSIFPGVKARFIFRNNDNPVGGPHEADALADLVVIPPGFTLQFPKQPAQGGVGGNPWISVQFLNGGEPVGGEFLLGRCVQLLPGN
jgi:hypothetical protein